MAISTSAQKMLSNMAPNLIYAFIPESECTYNVFGSYVNNIILKRDAQRTFIQGVARANLYTNSELFYDYVAEQIKEVYGKDVQDVIYHLAQYGTMPGSLYENDLIAGCRGIGTTDLQNIDESLLSLGGNSSQGVYFDADGKLQYGSQSMQSQITYDSNGNQYYQQYSPYGFSFTSQYSNGSYNPLTASNGETTLNLANGNTVDSKSNNFWNNLNNALPAIQGLLATVLSILQQTLTPYEMSPSQLTDGWVVPYSNTSTASGNILLIGGVAAGAYLLMGDDKKKTKKKKK